MFSFTCSKKTGKDQYQADLEEKANLSSQGEGKEAQVQKASRGPNRQREGLEHKVAMGLYIQFTARLMRKWVGRGGQGGTGDMNGEERGGNTL